MSTIFDDSTLNNMKRFHNLYDYNKNVIIIEPFESSYLLSFYGKVKVVLFSPDGWDFV